LPSDYCFPVADRVLPSVEICTVVCRDANCLKAAPVTIELPLSTMYLPTQLLSRRSEAAPTMNTTFSTLVIVLLSLILSAIILAGILMVIRRHRKKARRAALANELNDSHHLTINTSRQSVNVYDEKRGLIKSGSSSPTIPEIHITFPDEEEPSGKRKSGRVVLVRVGEKSFGMEPLDQDAPPLYQRDNSRFQSIDLERIGGLKEKDSY